MVFFCFMAGVALLGLMVFAYAMPENAPTGTLNGPVIGLVVLAFLIGGILVSFPPFYSIVRHYLWDEVLPGVSEVTQSTELPPNAARKGDVLTATGTRPEGYKLQIKYLDHVGEPHFKLVNSHTFTLPEGATNVEVRWMCGNLVTAWASVADPAPADPTPVLPPTDLLDPTTPADPATTPDPAAPTPDPAV